MSKMAVIRLDKEAWKREWAEMAHKVVFEKHRPGSVDRIDYALLIVNTELNKPAGFCTVRELDSESVYWQYGGTFPETIGTTWVASVYHALIEWTRDRYKRITTLVSNQNIAYLKLCMKFGFRIIGVRCFKNEIYVELLNDLEEGGF